MSPLDERDEVDALVGAWAREHPGLDLAPMQVLSRVKRLAEVLDARRKSAYAGSGLEIWEFDVLAALRRAGEPYELSPGQLLRETHVTSGTMTNRVDRLAGRGLVERRADPDDGRAVIVRLTATGGALVDAALGDLLEAEQRMLAELRVADREALSVLLRKLLLAQR